MYIAIAVVFTLICWVVGVLFAVNFGLSQPQYGTKKDTVKFLVLFWTGIIVLFGVLPAVGFYIAL